ncbi:uncharacterized protein LOC126842042 [Adelges cooleyi]|uniref:uncharacterized protein LOC126842042 n=1 Tax=Adelges cooleyi TaxID=133065 RepID=UPI00217FE15F|nr:uncharacterized protein LOC126842042 [Adelges cooleyi]
MTKNIVTQSFKMIGFYPAPDAQYKRTYTATRIETSRLKELGKARRDITGNVIINVLTQKLDEFISGGQKYPVQNICVLIGIWVSLKMTSNTSVLNTGDVCEVQLLLGDKVSNIVKYRPFKYIYHQVKAKDIDGRMETLTAQLRDNLSIPLKFK